MPKEYIIYCDESIEKGQYYSDFYGGVLVFSEHINQINKLLHDRKTELNLFNEVKWTKVTEGYLNKYIYLMDTYFELVRNNYLKIRIMFRQNAIVPRNLTQDHIINKYFLLYYQFIKHSFGLRYSNSGMEDINLRFYFDDLPKSRTKSEAFKNHIFGLQSLLAFQEAKLKIKRRDIIDINSKDHVILQCMDIVLGAIAFRLNDGHKIFPPGKKRRGKRTIAKEKLYKHIHSLIRGIYPNFNIGQSTGKKGDYKNIWNHPYRHWSFRPKEFDIDETRYK